MKIAWRVSGIRPLRGTHPIIPFHGLRHHRISYLSTAIPLPQKNSNLDADAGTVSASPKPLMAEYLRMVGSGSVTQDEYQMKTITKLDSLAEEIEQYIASGSVSKASNINDAGSEGNERDGQSEGWDFFGFFKSSKRESAQEVNQANATGMVSTLIYQFSSQGIIDKFDYDGCFPGLNLPKSMYLWGGTGE
jgi:predicted ATPase